MTIIQLQYILAVAKHQNFTAAAENCFVTQPTLSMQIHKLEEELDVQIFDRSKKPIQLTDIGKKIVDQARIIVDETHRIKDIVDQKKGMIAGDFKVGIIPTIMPSLLPLFVKTFLKRYPKVNLIVEELQTHQILSGLKEGTLDAGIAATPLEDPVIHENPVYLEPLIGFVPEDSEFYHDKKINTNQLKIENMLLLEDGHCFSNSVINLCKSDYEDGDTNFNLQSGNFDTLIKLSKDGFGMTVLPYLTTNDLKDRDKQYLRDFHNPVPAREVSVIYHKSQLKMQIIKALTKTIEGIIRGVIMLEDTRIVSPLPKH